MKRFWKGLKWLLLIGAGLFLLAQLIRPAKTNPVVDPLLDLQNQTTVDPKIAAILDRSCNDCHSNKTRWPWYTNVAPVSWFVIGHVNDGRRDLNFSEWGRYNPKRRSEKLKQICELVTAEAMPLGTYTPLHANSALTADDKKLLCDWTAAERERIGAR